MKILIIYAYPNTTGYTHAILNNIHQGTEQQNTVKIIDLYKENFDPVLVFNEQKKRRNMQFDEETAIYREQILWADHLIFIFPIWWGGMPAILKGFIDKVFSKGFAYKYKGSLPVGLLKEKSAWIITTEDAPKWYKKLFQQDYGTILKKQVLNMFGIKKVKHYSLSSMKNLNDTQRKNFLQKMFEQASKLSA
ncbi:NAD(P)H dehydrogenase (quinone) [Enterococcus sp. DIV0840]|uniref:NAD(P)H-dependent oxidoreductase n=1 Tax=Enterococcus TaxID=1350 RepID=UPI001A8FA4D4|nr:MULTISPECIES: NAD(P)H-dependent oxidoreductase [Enterococcus]MBO0434189.1 NAD(P)H-dependent oxidoreductase [Enterococcus sp. DIV0849a]MBO0475344.1 NAD(P)H-dependent oxidoreductase [Enterococcus ureasiticus]